MSERSLSLIMLVENEEHDFVDYFLKLHTTLVGVGYPHDLVLAINGPSQFSRRCMQNWPATAPEVKIIELAKKVSSAVCLQAVLPDCLGKVLIICGPYQQLDCLGLEQVLSDVSAGQVDLALPWRKNRVDPGINQLQSCLFNWLVKKMTGADFHDLSCLVRIVRKQVLLEVPLYGDLYRYLPLLAARGGFRVREYPVVHQQECGKIGFFGIREYINRFVDLIGMHFTLKFDRKPLRYFGLRGLIIFTAGFFCGAVAVYLRALDGVALGNSPWLLSGLLLMVAGSGVIGIGFLGEILSFVFGRHRKDYIVEKILE